MHTPAHPLKQREPQASASKYSALTGWRSLLHWTGFVVTREASIPNQRACLNPAQAIGLYPKSYKDTTKTHSTKSNEQKNHNQCRILHGSINKDTMRVCRASARQTFIQIPSSRVPAWPQSGSFNQALSVSAHRTDRKSETEKLLKLLKLFHISLWV